MDGRKWVAVGFLVIIGLFAALSASADTITAVSTSQVHVQAAIDLAVTGDIVVVPTGSSVWTSAVSIPNGKKITLRGDGIGSTVISRTSFGLVITLNDSGSRVSGFEFVEGQIRAQGVGWRIDHCKISSAAFNNAIWAIGRTAGQHPVGVIDHCTIVNCRVLIYGQYLDQMSWANEIWAQPLGLGTNNAVFIEDCLFDHTVYANAIDANVGGRFVFRHNVVNDTWLECHSIQGTHRGTRSWEVYGNTFNQKNRTMWMPARFRGGTGVVFNNTITGTFGQYVFPIDNVRSCEARGDGGLADGTSLWDGNTEPIETYQGYPVRDQIGRSTDEWLWTSENPYPPQAHEPAYCWNNKRDSGQAIVFVVGGCERNLVHIQENRDFYNNVQKPGYTPYTYPHPLIQEWDGGGESVPLAAPAGLRIQN